MAVSGKNAKLYVAQYNITQDFKSLDFSQSVGTYDDTTFGASDHTFFPTIKEGQMKASGYWKNGVGSIDDELRTIFGTADQPVSAFYNDDALGNPTLMCKAAETDYKIGAAVAGALTIDVAFKPGMSGKVVTGVCLHPLGTDVGTGNGTGVDGGATNAPSTTGWTANNHVTAMVGAAPSVVTKIQHSTDNITFVDLPGGAFAAATSLTGTSQQLVGAAGASVNRYVREVHTFGGTTTSITNAVTFARS